MTTYYSSLFGPETGEPLLAWDPDFKREMGESGGIIRYKRAYINLVTEDRPAGGEPAPTGYNQSEFIRTVSFHSSDRIIDVFLSTQGQANGNLTMSAQLQNDFISGGTSTRLGSFYFTNAGMTSESRKTSLFFQGGTLGADDRGKPLWDHMNQHGLTTYSEDPKVAVDIITDVSFTPTNNATGEFVIEFYYIQAEGGTNYDY